MKDLAWFVSLIIGIACFQIGGMNLIHGVHEIIKKAHDPKHVANDRGTMPLPESIFMFLAGLFLLIAKYIL